MNWESQYHVEPLPVAPINAVDRAAAFILVGAFFGLLTWLISRYCL